MKTKQYIKTKEDLNKEIRMMKVEYDRICKKNYNDRKENEKLKLEIIELKRMLDVK